MRDRKSSSAVLIKWLTKPHTISLDFTYQTPDSVYFNRPLPPLRALPHLFQPSQYLVRRVTVIDRGFGDRGRYSGLGSLEVMESVGITKGWSLPQTVCSPSPVQMSASVWVWADFQRGFDWRRGTGRGRCSPERESLSRRATSCRSTLPRPLVIGY